jgi:hypothetical protein
MHNRIALAAALTVGLLSTAAIAQTSEEQQLCMDDAFRVCSATIPDRTRTIACMVANKSRLSPGCQGVMDKYASGSNAPAQTAAMTPVRTAAPVSMRTAGNSRPGKPLNILMR